MGLLSKIPQDLTEEAERMLGKFGELMGKGYNFADGLVDQFFADISYPRINVSENGTIVKVRIEAAGVDPKQLKIQVTDGCLFTVAGTVEEEAKEDDEYHVRFEQKQGAFERTVELPLAVDPASAEVTAKNGVVTVTFKKQEPKTVNVTVKVE